MKKMIPMPSTIGHCLDALGYLPLEINRIIHDYSNAERWVKDTLGDRFLGAELLTQAWGDVISGIPSFPDLTAVDMRLIEQGGRDGNVILVCIPGMILNRDLTIMNLKAHLWEMANSHYPKEVFYSWGWYDDEPFATCPIRSGWYLIRTDVPAQTRNESYTEQEYIIDRFKLMGWKTLEIGPAVFGMVLFNLQTGKNTIFNVTDSNVAFCEEMTTGRLRVRVSFGLDGIHIDDGSDGGRDYYLGRGLLRIIAGAVE